MDMYAYGRMLDELWTCMPMDIHAIGLLHLQRERESVALGRCALRRQSRLRLLSDCHVTMTRTSHGHHMAIT